MLSLSINEQKQISGGFYYLVKVYTKKVNNLIEKRSFPNYQTASNFAKNRVNAGYRVDIMRK